MAELSDRENREIPFSRRFTLSEIWAYLSRKYSGFTDVESEEETPVVTQA